MVKIVEYKIISGSVIEIRRCRMPIGAQAVRRRAPRKAAASSLKKIAQNERAAARRLARIINTNFGTGDLFLTLKYSDARLPANKADAKKTASKFLRNLGRAFKKQTGRKLRYVICTSDTSSKTSGKARLHHHIIMDRAAYELCCKYWPQAEMAYELLDGRQDHTDLARYILKNSSKDDKDHAWSTSRGLDKPIVTEPEPVTDFEIKAPKGAEVREKTVYIDEDYGTASAYMRAVLDAKPTVRGETVHFPRQKNKKEISDTDKARIARANIERRR